MRSRHGEVNYMIFAWIQIKALIFEEGQACSNGVSCLKNFNKVELRLRVINFSNAIYFSSNAIGNIVECL